MLRQPFTFKAERTVIVAPTGGDYATISTALAAIVDAAADKQYQIVVYGSVAEVAQIVAKSHVHVRGVAGASVTVTSTGNGSGLSFESLTNTIWRGLRIYRAGVIPNGVTLVYTVNIGGTCDSTVYLEDCHIENLCTAAGTADHLAGLVVEDTSNPVVRDCTCVGGVGADYGQGLWAREGATGLYIDCVAYGGSGAANNWAIYSTGYAKPTFVNCQGYGGQGGINCYGFYFRAASAPTVKDCQGVGGDGGNGCHGLKISEASAPVIEGGLFRGGVGGNSDYGITIDDVAAPQICGTSAVPRTKTGQEVVTGTTTFVIDAAIAQQIRSIGLQVNVAGGGGATLSISTAPAGTNIVNAQSITSTGWKSPALGSGALTQLVAGATLHVTITGTGSPNVTINYVVDYVPSSSYACYIGSTGKLRIDNCTLIGNCSSYGLTIGTNAVNANALRVTNSYIEARPKSAGSVVAIYATAAYSAAPIYNCIIVGGMTNVVPATGTVESTSLDLAANGAAHIERLMVWVADNVQNPSLGTLPANTYVAGCHIHVTELFNSDAADEISVGYDAAPTAFATATDVSSTGDKAVTAGAETGFNATLRAVEAYYVNGGSEPNTGKALVTLEFYRVKAEVG